MSEALRLVSLKVSPWSERAKWALDHHGLAYDVIEHVPFLGERRLRQLVGPSPTRATVPVLLTGSEKLTQSWDIARYADQVGQGQRLITDEREPEIRAVNDLADRAMAAGRTLIVAALLASPEALDETLPAEVPAWLRPLLRPISRYGSRWFGRKHQLGPDADIAMASLLQGVVPVANVYIPLGRATRRAWTREDLAAEFADLIAWRDELYLRHRRPAPRIAEEPS